MIKVKQHMNRSIVVAILVSIMLPLIFNMVQTNTVVHADEINDIEKQIQALNEKQKQIDSQLNDLGGKIEYEEENQIALKEKITNTEQQIALYEKKITAMGESIAIKEQEITAKLADIDANEKLFEQRVRSAYIAQTSSSTLNYILSAGSFSELLTRAEMMKRISQSDQDLIDSLKVERDELNTIKADMELQNTELNNTKTSLKANSEQLATMKKQSEENEKSLLATQERYYKEKQATKKEIQANEAEIDRILKERADQGNAPGGAYKWPVPSSSRITSPFGMRKVWNKPDFHTGIDIGAKSGASILAAQPGTVIMVKKVNYGYGWHVLIDHGGGHATLYAHTSRIDVSEGQQVQRGDVIAGVGTTGASTGNHLHFEVRINSEKKDPMGYVVKP